MQQGPDGQAVTLVCGTAQQFAVQKRSCKGQLLHSQGNSLGGVNMRGITSCGGSCGGSDGRRIGTWTQWQHVVRARSMLVHNEPTWLRMLALVGEPTQQVSVKQAAGARCQAPYSILLRQLKIKLSRS